MMTNLAAVLETAGRHAESKKIDPAVFVNARLAPDMFPLARQVQIASDTGKVGAARLAGVAAPSFEDNETTLPELVDVTTDREQNGLQANVVIDRQDAARYGVRIQDIDNALNNAFSQRQISTIYSARNQYRVVLEIDTVFMEAFPDSYDRAATTL